MHALERLKVGPLRPLADASFRRVHKGHEAWRIEGEIVLKGGGSEKGIRKEGGSRNSKGRTVKDEASMRI